MTKRMEFSIVETDEAATAAHEGVLIGFYRPANERDGAPIGVAETLDARSDGQIRRALAGAGEAIGETVILRAPYGLEAERLALLSVGDGALDAAAARKLGAAAAVAIGAAKVETARAELGGIWPSGDAEALSAAFAYGLELRGYRFDVYKSEPGDAGPREIALAGARGQEALDRALGLAEGVLIARDLVNEPANVLHPESFAERIREVGEAAGLEVEILDEAAMEKLGMRALLAVGRGSRKASRLATMRWRGAADAGAAPVAFIGKGVCFDTGGVSLKPAAGMEEMTMDMGGAATVVGAMLALARRKSPVNAVGVVGLVENMPDGAAQRPGAVDKSMSGKTIEVINADAEGRLVLCDAMWRAQEAHKPRAMIDLATLTGAVIIALGHHNAGLFANDDDLAAALLSAAAAEGEGLWRLPLAKEYDQQLKSRIADMKNVGGRPAGSVTAAQFLQRFVKDGQAWAHIDIAGVASVKEATPLAPKGATGWGVATLVRYAESLDG